VRINAQVVYKYRIQSGIQGTGNICIQVVANHNTLGISGVALSHGKTNGYGVFRAAAI